MQVLSNLSLAYASLSSYYYSILKTSKSIPESSEKTLLLITMALSEIQIFLHETELSLIQLAIPSSF